MKILIFEYATAVGFDDPSLLCEGRAILEGLLEDFYSLESSKNDREHDGENNLGDNIENNRNYSIHNYDIHYLIAENFLKKEYLQDWPYLNPIILKNDLKSWINQNISSFDYCIFVAAEENLELYELSCLIEEKGVEILGSSSEAVLICSDKYKTYHSLKGKAPLINTHKLFINDFKASNNLPQKIIDKYGPIFDSGLKMVLKPSDGVACQGIKIVESLDALKDAVKSIETGLPYVLLQDYVPGDSCSVSLLSDGINAFPLSLNRQKIDFSGTGFEYEGGEVPWEHPLSKQALQVAKEAVESIDGLKGFVGVDLILSDQIHLVEINSRLTTPYVALRKLINFNLVKATLDASVKPTPESNSFCDFYGDGFNPNDFEGKIVFKKQDEKLNIQFKD